MLIRLQSPPQFLLLQLQLYYQIQHEGFILLHITLFSLRETSDKHFLVECKVLTLFPFSSEQTFKTCNKLHPTALHYKRHLKNTTKVELYVTKIAMLKSDPRLSLR